MKPFFPVIAAEVKIEALLAETARKIALDPDPGRLLHSRCIRSVIDLDKTGPFPFPAMLGAVRLNKPAVLVCDDLLRLFRLQPFVVDGAGREDPRVIVQQMHRVRHNGHHKKSREKSLKIHAEKIHVRFRPSDVSLRIDPSCAEHSAVGKRRVVTDLGRTQLLV